MGNALKTFASKFKSINAVETTGTLALNSETCPPPGSTITKTIWIFCFYKDSQGNNGWCILR